MLRRPCLPRVADGGRLDTSVRVRACPDASAFHTTCMRLYAYYRENDASCSSPGALFRLDVH